MRIQLMSDIHTEFGWGRGDDFIKHLDPAGVDVLILAGDICVGRNLLPAMRAFCEAYNESTVLWVHGNHEYYQSDRETINQLSKQAEKESQNLKWLNKDVITIKGQRFLGSTLWFSDHPQNAMYKHELNDFHIIRGFENWVYKENEAARKFISDETRLGDVVISHHLPSEQSVAPQYKGAPLNRFYVSDVHDLIVDRAPRLWVHGHTHESCDYKIPTKNGSECRVVCNPRGYWKTQLNYNFIKDLYVDV